MSIACALAVVSSVVSTPSSPIVFADAFVNSPPATPTVTEPALNGQVLSPADVHMETSPFSDVDAGDQHQCTDWEIWTVTPSQRVWSTLCIGGVERVHTHLGDGDFENSHVGRTELFYDTDYQLRVRHSDDSGDPATRWSGWATRDFHTGSAGQPFALELEDLIATPPPKWTNAATGADIVLPQAATQPALWLESAQFDALLQLSGLDGVANQIVDPPPLSDHEHVRVRIFGGSSGLSLPVSDLSFVDEHCERHTLLLPALTLVANETRYLWAAQSGATYVGSGAQSSPNFSTLARGLVLPWSARRSGFVVEEFAGGFQLPVNIAFKPNAGPLPTDPFLYVTELYGAIKVVTRAGAVSTFAGNLLNFNPTGAFPGSGEQGLAGIAVDPVSGDVFAGLLYDSASSPGVHYPRIERFVSVDGGRTAAWQLTVLDMAGEPQGQSHQISNLTITPDHKLICHMGDGFNQATAQNLSSFRGKILRLEFDGSPAIDNPFYDAGDGITARDYVYCYGVRNPFGGDWRAADGKHYVVENGPSVDRFAQLVPGRNYLWNGGNGSMFNFALYNWSPSTGPVCLAFVQPETFGGSGFPESAMGHAFVTESGPTYGNGPQDLGKRVTEWVLDSNGALVAGPLPFLEYAGAGRATACGLEAGPDGLYMTELYADAGTNPTQAGARLLRIRFDSSLDCNGNGADDACDIATGASGDANANGTPDECECEDLRFCQANASSVGQPARIASNHACFASVNAFGLVCTPVPNQPGLFFYGAGVLNGGAGAPFYDGFRCVSTPTQRLGVVQPLNHIASLSVDANAVGPAFALQPGSTWRFQYWFRDAPAGGTGANLSDAIAVTFQ